MKTFPLMMALSLGAANLQFPRAARAAETPAQRAGRKVITAAYAKMDRAIVTKDIATAISYFTPEYSAQTLDGQIRNRAQSEAMLRQVMNGPVRFSKMTSRIMSLTWRGKDAIVTSQSTGVARAGTGAGAARIEAVGLSRDYWTPTPRGWKIRQTVETQSKMWVNGKPLR